MDVLVCVSVLSALFVILVLWRFFDGRKRPPGPVGWPLLGYLPHMSRHPYLDLQRLAKQYGGVFGVRLGGRYVVVFSDYQSTKEAFAKDAFMGRPAELPFEVSQQNKDTQAFFGLKWREQRRFAVHMLRDLGLGKSKMEDQLQEEITELLEHFEQNADKPFCVRDLLAPSMSNNIGALMFGKRFKYDDPIRKMMTDAVTRSISIAQQVGWVIFFPWVRKTLIFLGIGKFNAIDKVAKELNYYARKEIEEHEKTLNPENIRDFIDGYLVEIQKRKGNPTFCKEILEDLVVGFFSAGSETVLLSVQWLVLMAASLPDAARRIQSEIDEVVGRNRLPEYPDQKSMPFTEAFIMELNRWRTVLPLNILRYTLFDTEASGFFIPKHTVAISNLWAVHHDKEYWGEDADDFRAERFLTEDGKTVKRWEHYMPFSTGNRACPGEPLAKVEVFLYFTSILQRFDIRLPDGQTPDFEGTLTVGLQPKDHDVILTKRH